jgi:tetratricopeptide (TPR) repeat protein
VGKSPQLAYGYAFMSLLSAGAGWDGGVDMYSRLADEAMADLPDDRGKPGALIRTGVARHFQGQTQVAIQLLQNAADLAERLRDWRAQALAGATMGQAFIFTGQFDRARKLCGDLYARSDARGDIQGKTFGISGTMTVLFRQGRHDEVIRAAEKAIPLIDQTSDKLLRAVMCAQAGQAYLYQGWVGDAWTWAQRSVDTFSKMNVTFALEAYFGVAEIAHELLVSVPSSHWPAEKKALLRVLELGCRFGTRAIRLFPVSVAQAAYWEGCRLAVLGKTAQARRTWLKGLGEARRLGFPWDEARAISALGRSMPPGNFERKLHLEKAIEIFSRLGAAHDLGIAREAAGLGRERELVVPR